MLAWSFAMIGRRPATLYVPALAIFFALLLVSARPAQAQTETVLYSFGSQAGDGEFPVAGLILDKKGNLYGTTIVGGAYGEGTVFELTAAGTEKVLYSFGSHSGDAHQPDAGLTSDKKGNLYGTTQFGGDFECNAPNGCGAVFELTAKGTEKVLYSFGSQSGDGTIPAAGLTFDKEGNLYGTTSTGGDFGDGTVFELTLAGTEKVLYSFGSQAGDGAWPQGGLIFDKKGNLYGTTAGGGAYGDGTVFELTAAGAEKILYSFGSYAGDGLYPYAGLIFDKKGNLYGTTFNGGDLECVPYGCGAVFELTKKGKENVLYSFGGSSGDGNNPWASLTFDKEGNLYGTTYDGGDFECDALYGCGTVFELTAAGTEKVLYTFGSQSGDGAYPAAGMTFDKKGNLYGTTSGGGAYDEGTVFKLTP
jgi:uncharacterized repeat protein (TIGR03803 family)